MPRQTIEITSEREAWGHVLKLARRIDTEEGIAIAAIADTMLKQLYKGVHVNPATRKQVLAMAQVAGYEGDTRTFTRLLIEKRVNRQAMNEAWASGVRRKMTEQGQGEQAHGSIPGVYRTRINSRGRR